MKQFSLSKVSVSLMSALLFAPLLMGSVSANASQTNTSNNATTVQNTSTNNSTSESSNFGMNNGNSSTSSSDGNTNTFNIPVSNETNDSGLFDGLYVSHTTAYIKKHFYDNLSPANRAAKLWIARHHESTYSYSAVNGDYYGRFQLTRSYLHCNYSKMNQEKTADRYISNKYGSWVNAKKAWLIHADNGKNERWLVLYG